MARVLARLRLGPPRHVVHSRERGHFARTDNGGPFRERGRLGLWVTAALAWMVPAFGAGAQEPVWELETWQVPFDYSSRSRPVRYEPLERATKKWRICTSYPHLKDSYWLSVNYGMVLEAERLGVALQVVEAGGYPNLARQITQVNDCTAGGPTFSWSEP